VFVGKDSTFVTAQEIKNALTPKTRLVCFTGASNLLADEVDIRKIVETIKEFNPKIFVLCDTTQYIEHFPVRCHYNKFDFCVGSGHKMIAPTGTGFVYIKKE
jgi:cysteine desulfurase/selenocysteine lyase